jgi:hypothetical protein
MKTPRSYFGALALFCVIALFIGTAGAAAVSGPDSSCFGNKTAHGGPVKMLDLLEQQGIDVSAIRAAFESGNMYNVHTLMQQFMELHKDLIPARNATEKDAHGFGPGMRGDHPASLEAKGCNVTAMRTALESGDNKTTRIPMEQCMESHKDLMPARNATEKNAPGFGSGMMENHLAQLEAKGYDVSAIRAAVESGDMDAVHTLMKQFMEAHKDEMPRHGAGRNGNSSWSVATI